VTSPIELARTFILTDEDFRRFATFVESELGIQVPPGKASMLQGRLARRLRELNIPSAAEYWEYLFHSPHADRELVHFIDAITTNKTDFFREPQHFEFLTRNILPEFSRETRKQGSQKFGLWCAGCSSGEEPYTLSIVLSEYSRSASHSFDFSILATDISTRVLKQARSGIYKEAQSQAIPPSLRTKYLLRSKEPSHGLTRIVPALRERISFHRLNFIDEDYRVRGIFEVIFFRNVMIYFDKPTQQEIVNKLCRNLKPGGYLFIGHSESLVTLDVPVKQIGPAIFRKPDPKET
jgi:chemotaxis protein methyltransferase CheR